MWQDVRSGHGRAEVYGAAWGFCGRAFSVGLGVWNPHSDDHVRIQRAMPARLLWEHVQKLAMRCAACPERDTLFCGTNHCPPTPKRFRVPPP
jgi:hypothetical protein